MDIKIDQNLRTEKVTSELITYIVRKIVKETQPEKIILFGSYAGAILILIAILIFS